MKILAIDPGTTESGWCIFDTETQKVEAAGKHNNKEIYHIMDEKQSLCKYMVMEKFQCFGMAIGETTIDAIFISGMMMQKWIEIKNYDAETAIHISRREVKMHLCNSMRAKDSNIRQALVDRFGKPGTKKIPNDNYPTTYKPYRNKLAGDEWSALALAVTFADSLKGEKV